MNSFYKSDKSKAKNVMQKIFGIAVGPKESLDIFFADNNSNTATTHGSFKIKQLICWHS